MTEDGFIVNDFAPENEKLTNKFAVQTMQNFWSKYNTGNFFNNRALNYRQIRAWAEGKQDTSELQDQVLTRLPGGEPDSSWANLDFNPAAILPVFIDGTVGDFMSLKYRVKCNAVDPGSKSKKLEAKQRDLNILQFQPVLQKLELATGIQSPKSKFETEEEIEVHYDNFKLGLETAVEKTVTSIFESCSIESIQRRMFYDLLNLKMAVVRCYYDINYRSQFEYIDPELYISTASLKEDFSDVNLEGHVEYVTIGELKRQSGWDNEKLYKIACKYTGEFGNSQTIGAYQPGLLDSSYQWMNNKVMVFHFEFLSIDNTNYKIKTNKFGKVRVYENEISKVPEENISRRIQNCYKGSWVVNSDDVYNYGMKENMIRKRLNGAVDTKTQTGYFKFAPNMRYGENKSHTERAITFAKQWQLAWTKLQQFLARAIPPGYKININGMTPVDLGNGKSTMGPIEMKIFHEQTSVYIYDSSKEGGDEERVRSPLEPFIIPIGELNKLMDACNFCFFQIRNVLGRPQGVDTSTPNPDMLVGVLDQVRKAAAISLEPLRNGFTEIMKNSINYLCMMVQDKGTSAYANAIGDLDVGLLELASDLELASLGMDIEYEPDNAERQQMRATLDFEVKNGKLPSEDALHIMTLPTLKLMMDTMKVKRKQYAREQIRIAQANTEAQTKSNIQAAQAAEAARKDTALATLKAQENLEWTKGYVQVFVEQKKADLAAGAMHNEHINTLAEMALQGQIALQQTPTTPNAVA